MPWSRDPISLWPRDRDCPWGVYTCLRRCQPSDGRRQRLGRGAGGLVLDGDQGEVVLEVAVPAEVVYRENDRVDHLLRRRCRRGWRRGETETFCDTSHARLDAEDELAVHGKGVERSVLA